MSDSSRTGHTPTEEVRRRRRGIFLLPSIVTVGNLFCGWACIVFAMRGDLATAAPFVGIAVVLDMLDGRIARLTNTTSAFGVEFDSLADVISFGLAPAVLAFAWGLEDLGRVGWAAGFVYVTATAMRLARFNIQSALVDKRYFIGMPSPAAAGVAASTVFAYPVPLEGYPQAAAALAVVLVPAALMVSTVRFRWGPSYMPLFVFAVLIALIATEPRVTLVVIAYGYLASALIEWLLGRLRSPRERPPAATT
jgi:CDP-diacylglycerol--serine O-phosphatidyltransferase